MCFSSRMQNLALQREVAPDEPLSGSMEDQVSHEDWFLQLVLAVISTHPKMCSALFPWLPTPYCRSHSISLSQELGQALLSIRA